MILVIAELVIVIVICVLSERFGFGRGREKGFKLGRIHADNWWLEAERQIDDERKKIWMEDDRRKNSWP